MNGDGFADPAVANLRDDDVVLLMGDGIGGFTLTRGSRSPPTRSTSS